MVKATGETLIRRSMDDVFAFLADARNEPTWLPGGESVEKMTAGEMSLGTVFEGRYRGAGTGSARGCAFRSTEELNV